MGIFDGLFGKKQEKGSSDITIEFIDNGFVINGHQFPFPARASEMIKVLGKPRVIDPPNPGNVNALFCRDYGFDIDTFRPLNYYWDEAGIFARTFDHETIHVIGVCLQPNNAYIMPTKCFSGTFLIKGKPWQEAVVKNPRTALQFDTCYSLIYGNTKKEKNVKYLDYKLHSDEIDFFEMTDEARKILSFIDGENVIQQAEIKVEESDIYIMDKYWNDYIGGREDSLTLLDYLADKNTKKITLGTIFSDLGFDKPDFDFRNPQGDITVVIKDNMEIPIYYAIQTICDLSAILLECKKNKSVDLQELAGGSLEKDKVVMTIVSTVNEEKILLDALSDFCNSPMEYNLSEMCGQEEMEEMASVCQKLLEELRA